MRCPAIFAMICFNLLARISDHRIVGLWWEALVRALAFTSILWEHRPGIHCWWAPSAGVCSQRTPQKSCSRWNQRRVKSKRTRPSPGSRTSTRKHNRPTGQNNFSLWRSYRRRAKQCSCLRAGGMWCSTSTIRLQLRKTFAASPTSRWFGTRRCEADQSYRSDGWKHWRRRCPS